MTPIRVLLADDHELVRAGFRALPASLSDVENVIDPTSGAHRLLSDRPPHLWATTGL